MFAHLKIDCRSSQASNFLCNLVLIKCKGFNMTRPVQMAKKILTCHEESFYINITKGN